MAKLTYIFKEGIAKMQNEQNPKKQGMGSNKPQDEDRAYYEM